MMTQTRITKLTTTDDSIIISLLPFPKEKKRNLNHIHVCINFKIWQDLKGEYIFELDLIFFVFNP